MKDRSAPSVSPQAQRQKDKKALRYIASLVERSTQYTFPLFLLMVEWFLRKAFKLNTQEFIGPTLTAAGIGMTIALTSYASADRSLLSIPDEVKRYVEENHLRIEPVRSGVFRNFCWVATLTFTLLWIWSITLSTQQPNSMLWVFPTHYYPGFISFFLGFLLSELKEVIL